jgi:hypothetical protein
MNSSTTGKRVFILGAGCSYSDLKILTKNLFQNIYDDNTAYFSKDKSISKFLKYLYPNGLSGHFAKNDVNIEDLLSTIDAAINTPTINDGAIFSKEILQKIKETLSFLIVKQLWTSPAKQSDPYSQFVEIYDLDNTDTIITFNYDTLLDRVIMKKFNVSTLNELYFEQSNLAPRLLKLHGSINWIFKDNKVVPITWQQQPTTNNRYAIIPPTLYKNPGRFEELWGTARAALSQASDIWFIGYSMPPLDISARYVFRRGIRMNFLKKNQATIHVVNPDSTVLERFCTQLHPEIDYKRATFDEFLEKFSK